MTSSEWLKELRSYWSFYGEDAAVDDGAKMGQSEARVSDNTPGVKSLDIEIKNIFIAF